MRNKTDILGTTGGYVQCLVLFWRSFTKFWILQFMWKTRTAWTFRVSQWTDEYWKLFCWHISATCFSCVSKSSQWFLVVPPQAACPTDFTVHVSRISLLHVLSPTRHNLIIFLWLIVFFPHHLIMSHFSSNTKKLQCPAYTLFEVGTEIFWSTQHVCRQTNRHKVSMGHRGRRHLRQQVKQHILTHNPVSYESGKSVFLSRTAANHEPAHQLHQAEHAGRWPAGPALRRPA